MKYEVDAPFLLSIRSEDIFYLKAFLQLLNEYIN